MARIACVNIPQTKVVHIALRYIHGIGKKYSNDIICIPNSHKFLSPILSSIPLQLLAYYIAILRGCDVDQPRNLAKSVTVE